MSSFRLVRLRIAACVLVFSNLFLNYKFFYQTTRKQKVILTYCLSACVIDAEVMVALHI